MAQQIVNIGSTANDGTGDPLRTCFEKINANFSEIYGRDAVGSNIEITANTISSTNANGNIELHPDGAGHVKVLANNMIIAVSKTPTSSIGIAGDRQGMICWDSGYVYICTADYNGTSNIWRRAALSSNW